MRRSVAFSTAPDGADEPPQRVDEVRRGVARRRFAYVFQPTTPTRAAGSDALVGEDLGERTRSVARLARAG